MRSGYIEELLDRGDNLGSLYGLGYVRVCAEAESAMATSSVAD